MLLIAKALPTYIKDNNHALRILNEFGFQSDTKFLFTMDVSTFLEPATATLLRLAELVLTLQWRSKPVALQARTFKLF